MAIEYFTDDDGSFKEFSAIRIPRYQKPENFPAGDQFTESVFNNTYKWLSDAAPCFGNEKVTMLACNITLRVDTTRHVILTYKDSEEWVDLITDYIEAMIYAFKKPEIGLPCYLKEISSMILSSNEISEEQKGLLAYYIDLYKGANHQWLGYSDFEIFDAATLLPANGQDDPKDVIIMGNQQNGSGQGHLTGIYQKWLKMFPFELGCFKHDKQYFMQRFSDFICKNDERTNRYLELTFKSTKTQSEFISFLIDTTKLMLYENQSIEWAETADSSDIKSRQLALIRHTHRVKQEKLLTTFTEGEKVYIKILKEWLKNEKTFFEELTSCLPNHTEPQKTDTSTSPVLGSITELFPMSMVGKLHEYCNGKLFEMESVDLYQILNTPDQWHKTVKVKNGEITRMKLLLYLINEHLAEKDVATGHVESICMIFGFERRECLKRKKLHEDYYAKNGNYLKQIQMILTSETD